ncbi:MAG: DUF6516 family protein [Bacteroidota bacterium]
MISVLEEFSNVIVSYEIKTFRDYGVHYEFVAIARLKNNSTLHIRDYRFRNGERKYSYHWQTNDKRLIVRWDNANHHRQLGTFPFHKHIENNVEESQPMTIRKVLEFISKEISRK